MMSTRLLLISLLTAISFSCFSQADSLKADLDERFWSLENEVRTYLHAYRHSKDEQGMKSEAEWMTATASSLSVLVAGVFDLAVDRQLAILREDTGRKTSGPSLVDSVHVSNEEAKSAQADLQSKEYPYWLWTLSEIQRITEAIQVSNRLKDIHRLNQELSTVVPLD